MQFCLKTSQSSWFYHTKSVYLNIHILFCTCEFICHLGSLKLKGQFSLKPKHISFMLPILLFIYLDCFAVHFADIGCEDVLWHVVIKAQKNAFEKLSSNVSFQKS